MAIQSASAKLYTGIRCWCVDKNISASLSSAFTVGNKNRPIESGDTVYPNILVQRLKRTSADLESVGSVSLTNQRYKTYGGGNNVITAGSPRVINNTNNWKVTSRLVCKFPTYFQIDIEKLQLPEGTTCTVQLEEGWITEGDFPETTRAPSPEVRNFFTFRTPWYGVGRLTPIFSLFHKTTRIKQLSGSVVSAASVTARPIFNPGKLAALFGGAFTTITNARKTTFNIINLYSFTGGGSETWYNSFFTRIRPFLSNISSAFSTSINGDKYKTGGLISMPSVSSLASTAIRQLGVITSNILSSFTTTSSINKFSGGFANITSNANQVVSAKVVKGLIQNISATSSLSMTGSIAMVLETTASTFSVPILYGNANCTINWGDGQTTTVTSTNGNFITHTYSSPYGVGVTKQVKISGYVQHFGFQQLGNMPDHTAFSSSSSSYQYYYGAGSLTKIVSFGDLGFETFVGAFPNARYLTSIPTRLPSTVTDISRMFWHTVADDQFQNISNIQYWDVSNVTKMRGTFIRNRNGFNPNLSSWNVSNVTHMDDLFVFCDSGFNPDLNSWNVGNVITFRNTFYNTSNFNTSLSAWDVHSANDMTQMFYSNMIYDQDLSGWCVANIATEPTNFGGKATWLAYRKPQWGTCP